MAKRKVIYFNDKKYDLSTMSDKDVEKLYAAIKEIEHDRTQSRICLYTPTKPAALFHQSDAKERWLFGGNGSGKTVAGAKEAVCHIMGEDLSRTTKKKYRRAPTEGWVCGVDLSVVENVLFEEIKSWLPKGQLIRYDRANHTMFFKNGSRVTGKSYDSDVSKWQSAALHWAWCDEQVPYIHYKELQSRVNRRDGYIWSTMTPIHANSAWAFNEIYLPWEAGKYTKEELDLFEVDLADNTFISEGARMRQYAAFKDDPEANARLHGKFVFLSGLVHPEFQLNHHVVPVKQLAGLGYRYARVIDMHPRAPNTCSWFAYRDRPYPEIRVIDELIRSDMHVRDFANMLKWKDAFVADSMGHNEKTEKFKIEFTIIDTPESNSDVVLGTSMRSEMACAGIAGIKANRNFLLGRQKTSEYMAHDPQAFFIHSNCAEHIRQLRGYAWDNWRGKGAYDKNPKEKPQSKDDHCVRNMHFMACTMPPINAERHEVEMRDYSQKKYGVVRNYQRAGV